MENYVPPVIARLESLSRYRNLNAALTVRGRHTHGTRSPVSTERGIRGPFVYVALTLDSTIAKTKENHTTARYSTLTVEVGTTT